MSMKTAVSIPDDLFNEIDRLAKERQCSRSEIIASAVKEFFDRIHSRRILDALNEVYEETDSEEEKMIRRKAVRKFSKILGEDGS